MLACHLLQFSNSLVGITLPKTTDPPLPRDGFDFRTTRPAKTDSALGAHRELNWLTILLGYTLTVAPFPSLY